MKHRLICVLLMWTALAQAQGLIGVRHYSTEDGLSQNGIQDIVQDSKGYVWMVSRNGLERFDGYEFLNFKSYPTDDVRLKHNRMTELVADSADRLWCKTYDKRVYMFDSQTKKFVDVWEAAPGQRCTNVKTMKALENGVVWIIGEDGGLWRCDGTTGKDKVPESVPAGSVRRHGRNINDIVLDPFGNEWILNADGAFIYGKAGVEIDALVRSTVVLGGSFYLATRKGEIYEYDSDGGLRKVGTVSDSNGVSGIHALKDGRMAVVTERRMLAYDPRTAEMAELCEFGYERRLMSLLTFMQDGEGNLWLQNRHGVIFRYDMGAAKLDSIYYDGDATVKNLAFIHGDRYGQVWVLPPDADLMCYNSTDGIFVPAYMYEDGRKRHYDSSFYGKAVLSYMFDRQGNLWHCSDGGFNKITFEDNSYRYIPSANKTEVRSLFVDSRQRLWVGNKNGNVEIYDKNHVYIGNLTANGKVVKSRGEKFSEARIYCFFEDADHRIWLGSREHGLYVAEPRGDGFQVRQYRQRDGDRHGLNCNSIYSIAQDSVGRIWVGTYGGGLNLVEGQYPDLNFVNSSNGMSSCGKNGEHMRVRTINCTSEGVIMVGTTDGLVCFSQDFKNADDIEYYCNQGDDGNINSLANNDVMSVLETGWGDIYVVSYGGGVSRIVSDTLLSRHLQFQHLNKTNGLPSDIAYALMEENGHVWISLETCLCRYNPKTQEIETFWKYNRDLHLLNSEADIVLVSGGMMCVGTTKGLLRINLGKIRKSDFMPPVVFNGVTIRRNDTEVESIIGKDNSITLAPDERNVTINFAALDYTNVDNLQYAYRLKEASNEWIYVDRLHSASFVNLPVGYLTLEVRSTNGDGVWCNNISRLLINVKPTFWETGWAWVVYILAVLLIIVLAACIIVYIFDLRRKVDFEQQITNLKLRFFTDISHELRTPLTLITAPVEEVMQEEQLSSKGRESLHIAKQNVDRMLRLINQLLDFRKIQNDKMKIYVEQVDVIDVSHRIFKNFSSLAKQRNIDFNFISDAESRHIFTDVDKFEKILFNLLSNAFKYTPNGRAIRLEIADRGDMLEFLVADDGQGFDMNKIDLLFSRFETLGKSSDDNSSGIGLSLVNEFVRLIHGTIKAESYIGQGSRFIVTIPVDYRAFADDDNVEFILNDSNVNTDAEGVVQNTPEESVPDTTLLIVEDNEELRRFMVMMLSENYRVLEACNGVEGLALIKNNQPDIVISDIMMPIMDGLELLHNTRRNDEVSHIPFILLTAKANLDDRIMGLDSGADDYITKPFSGSYLKARVSSLLKQRAVLLDYYMEKYSHADSVEKVDDTDTTAGRVPSLTEYDKAFVQQIMEQIESRLMDTDFKIEDLVEEMNISRSVFYRKIRALLGVSPKDIVSEVRMKKAIRLLEAGESNISEIAYKTGFTSPQYFAKVFKKAKGCTPSEYRKKI